MVEVMMLVPCHRVILSVFKRPPREKAGGYNRNNHSDVVNLFE
jgi:hypothetical protein